MSSQTDTAGDFLQQLSAIDNPANTPLDKTATIALLKAADDLFDESKKLKDLITDGKLPSFISGSAYLEETVDGQQKKRAVVDLVQQGGTMLGIGLVGYTYVMEKAGVRFRSMAGTSAGAINTLLIAGLPEKIYKEKSPFDNSRQATKSEFLAYLITKKDFTDLLDRDGLSGKIQKWLIRKINTLYKLRKFILWSAVILFFALVIGIYYLIGGTLFTTKNNLVNWEIKIYDFLMATITLGAFLVLGVLIAFSFFKKTMGFNPGKNVYDWITKILATEYVGVQTTQELKDRKEHETPIKFENEKACALEDNPPKDYKDNSRLVFITANLTHNRIVKFPERVSDYWNEKYAPFVNPAAYVRASMSLPFIFYAFTPGDEHVFGIPASRKKNVTIDNPARFVDGGMLSNFPIREFHVSSPAKPRFPTFGVLLGSWAGRTEEDENKKPDKTAIWAKFKSLSVFKFIVSFISTFRNFYDVDFLEGNKEIKQLVQRVNTKRFNSMDFGMSDKTKQQLFAEGAKAAIKQLTTFNWCTYLESRVPKAPAADVKSVYNFEISKDEE